MRKQTREVKVGNLIIGNNNSIIIQSMCNTKTNDIKSTVAQIKALETAGCELIRVAVPNQEAVTALKEIKQQINIPLVADIHFDYRLAIAATATCDKIRINPGNIGSETKIQQVIEAAKKNNCAIRIGVNSGSLEKNILEKYGSPCAEALVESALNHIKFFEQNDFHNIIISVKASDVMTTINANKLLSEKCDYPLHIGVTEAGTSWSGTIKSAIGIGTLLSAGIGDTIRVSLTADPVEEVKVAYEIMKDFDLRKIGRTIISCPTCGRTHGNLIEIAIAVEKATAHIKKPIKIAVMGCEVNGPGEASNADIGVALNNDSGIIFKKGKIIKRVEQTKIVEELLKEIGDIDE